MPAAALVIVPLAVGALLVASIPPPAGASAQPHAISAVGISATGDWVWPVEGPRTVVRQFLAPATAYSAGHRGVDLAATTIGAEVRAATGGSVHFAGTVVDRGVVTIRQGQLLVTVEPVVPLVAQGSLVAAGDLIATLDAGHCASPCVHLGVRLAGEYVSPLRWLGGLQRAVLLPLHVTSANRSGAWVRGAIDGRQPLGAHVGVHLGGAETRVSENLLHGAEVGASVEQMSRGAVPEGVRTGGATTGQIGEHPRDEGVDGSSRDPPAAGSVEERSRLGKARRSGCEQWSTSLEVGAQGALRRQTEGHDALLRALAQHANDTTRIIDVMCVEPDELADAQSARVEQLDHRPIAQGRRIIACAARFESVE